MPSTILSPNSLTCFAIATAVLMGAIHAKEVANLSLPAQVGVKTTIDDPSQHMVKITSELHHHSDASAKIQAAGDGQQADHRSLRLMHHKKIVHHHKRTPNHTHLWV